MESFDQTPAEMLEENALFIKKLAVDIVNETRPVLYDVEACDDFVVLETHVNTIYDVRGTIYSLDSANEALKKQDGINSCDRKRYNVIFNEALEMVEKQIRLFEKKQFAYFGIY